MRDRGCAARQHPGERALALSSFLLFSLPRIADLVLCSRGGWWRLQEYYVRELEHLESMREVLDLARSELTHVEPWMSGNARGASTAFCLLYKLLTLRPSTQQLVRLLEQSSSQHARALGFLLLRYSAEPKTLWWWFAKFLRDDSVFCPSAACPSTPVSIGAFCRDLLLDQYYFETIFPRIPETIRRGFKTTLSHLGFDFEPLGCGGVGGTRRQIDDGSVAKRPQSVKAALSVNLAQRAPHLPSNREQGRGLDSTYSKADTSTTSSNIKPKQSHETERVEQHTHPRDAQHQSKDDSTTERTERHGRKERDQSCRKRLRSRSRDRDRDRDRNHKERRRSRSRERRKRSKSRNRSW